DAYNAGWRSFYLPDGLTLNNSSFTQLGSSSDPVTLVTPGAISINGNITVYGMLFANDATTNDIGTGNSTIIGALVACRNYASNGNGTLSYDPSVTEGIQAASTDAVRVPGSWTDSCKLSSAGTTAAPATPTRTCN